MGFKKLKWHKIAGSAEELQWTRGDVAEVMVEGTPYCIGRFQDEWYGFSAVCPHAGAPMIDAYVSGGCQVVCPVHQLKFNLKTGRDSNDEGYKLKTYPIEKREDGVYLGVEEGRFKWF